MKRLQIFSFFILVFFACIDLKAQMTAGYVSAGMSAVNPNINLIISVVGDTASAPFDVDCDGIDDFRIWFSKGETAVDGSNMIGLYLLNSDYQLCVDNSNYPPVTFYTFGDTLCNGSSQYNSGQFFMLACYGGFGCVTGPAADTIYFAYRNAVTLTEGWAQFSFSLNDAGSTTAPITCVLDRILASCLLEIRNSENEIQFSLYPNPSNDGKVRFHSNLKIERIEILDVTGRIVSVENNPAIVLLPDEKGLYLLRMRTSDGNYFTTEIVRD